MPSTKELRERAGAIYDEMRRMREEMQKRQAEKDGGKADINVWPEDNEKRWGELNAEYDSISKQIDEARNVEGMDAKLAEMAQRSKDLRNVNSDFGGDGKQQRGAVDVYQTIDKRNEALRGWGLYSRGGANEARSQAAKEFGFNAASPTLELQLLDGRRFADMQAVYASKNAANVRREMFDLEQRALSAHLGSSGGFTVGSTMVGALERNMLAYGGVLQVADTITTSSGEPMSWPTADDTSNTGYQIGENPSSTTQADPSFAAVVWNAYEFSSNMVKVPLRLFDDSSVDIGAILMDMLGERLGRILNTKCTTGTGAATIRGIVTAAASGKTAASATAITADEVIDLEHSVDPAYRVGSGFMCHDGVVQYLRKLKDGEGRYLWSSGLRDGIPDSINGYRLTINQDMASTVATTNKTLLFGQFSKYKVRRVGGVMMRRLDERFADTNQVAFLAIVRADGNLLDAGTAPVKYLQQA